MINLKQITDKIYWLSSDSKWELAMMFLRSQEMYESEFSEFYGSNFKVFDYMDKYVQHYKKDTFTYPTDWSGFNLSAKDLRRVYYNGHEEDWTTYDHQMKTITDLLHKRSEAHGKLHTNNIEFMLIGTMDGDTDTVKHEIAHCLYGLNKDYLKDQTNNRNSMADIDQENIYSLLRKMGYNANVTEDELQAYFSTGPSKDMLKKLGWTEKKWGTVSKPFIDTFKKYSKDII